MTNLFASVQPQLDTLVGGFVKQHKGNATELRSIAYEAFADAAAGWEINEQDAGWKAWLCQRAWWRLQDHQRRERRRYFREQAADEEQLPLGFDSLPEKADRVETLLADLGDDAKAVCRLLLDCPAELYDLLQTQRQSYSRRRVLRNWLAGLGWTAERIVSTFKELREALS